MSIKNSIFRTLKGAAIGVAIIIPGISGGTVAVLLEIYEEMIKAISSLRKEFKKSVLYLLPILIGMIIAFGIMYFPMKYALLYIPLQTISLFAGLMIGSCPKMITDAKKNGFKMINLISLIVPFVFVLGICFIPDMGDVDLSIDMPIINYLLLFIVGVVASYTLVIPGVSGSMFLLIIGISLRIYSHQIISFSEHIFEVNDSFNANFIHASLCFLCSDKPASLGNRSRRFSDFSVCFL